MTIVVCLQISSFTRRIQLTKSFVQFLLESSSINNQVAFKEFGSCGFINSSRLDEALLLFFRSRLRSAVNSDSLKRNYHSKRTTGPGYFKTLNELVVFMKELRMRIAVFMVSYLIFQKN